MWPTSQAKIWGWEMQKFLTFQGHCLFPLIDVDRGDGGGGSLRWQIKYLAAEFSAYVVFFHLSIFWTPVRTSRLPHMWCCNLHPSRPSYSLLSVKEWAGLTAGWVGGWLDACSKAKCRVGWTIIPVSTGFSSNLRTTLCESSSQPLPANKPNHTT